MTVVLILLALSIFLPGVCLADDGADMHPPVDPASGSVEETIARTGYSVGLQAGYGIEIKRSADLPFVEALPSVSFPISGAMGRSFYRGVLEYKIEPVLGLLTGMDDRGEAGLDLIGLRYNFTGLGRNLAPYLEMDLGGVYVDVPKRIQGTRFNFTECAAAGLRYFVSRRIALDLQARFRHLSNAGIKEPNPGIDTGFLMLGMSYY